MFHAIKIPKVPVKSQGNPQVFPVGSIGRTVAPASSSATAPGRCSSRPRRARTMWDVPSGWWWLMVINGINGRNGDINDTWFNDINVYNGL